MTVLEQYQKTFKDLKTKTVTENNIIKLYVWSEALLSGRMVKDVLRFNLDGSEIHKESTVNFL